MTIRINSSLLRKFFCVLGFHKWYLIGAWQQEKKQTIDDEWYTQYKWNDYYCPFCGKWVKSGCTPGFNGYVAPVRDSITIVGRIKLPDIITDQNCDQNIIMKEESK